MTGSGVTRRRLAGSLAAGFALRLLPGCTARDRDSIGFYNWDSYVGTATLAGFERRTGTHVELSTFATDDELLAKLSAGSTDYDVIVPSHLGLQRLREANLLRPLDHRLLPARQNLMPFWRDPAYDRGNRHSVPYTWQVLGLGYRRSRMPPTMLVPDSWGAAFADTWFDHRVALIEVSPELIELAATYLGQPLNHAGIAAATAMLVRRKPAIKLFHTDDGQELLLTRAVDLVVEYNSDIAAVMHRDADLDFVVPREGGLLSADVLAIPSGSTRPAAAHAFIDYLLGAERARDLALLTGYSTPNAAARALMPPSYRDNPVLFPTGPGMAASYFSSIIDLATTPLVDAATTRIRSAPPVAHG